MSIETRDGELLIQTWKVRGTNDDDGAPETSTVVLRRNIDWRGPGDLEEYRFHTFCIMDDPDDEIDLEGHDTIDDAQAKAKQLRADLTAEYVERAMCRRERRAQDLRDICSSWADGPERQIVESVANSIEGGTSVALLDAVGRVTS